MNLVSTVIKHCIKTVAIATISQMVATKYIAIVASILLYALVASYELYNINS